MNIPTKGELEHRSPKARYTRTSRKGYLRQITQIERRQTRVRQIRERHRKAEHSTQDASPPNVHHVIGKSQNHPESIPLFLRKYSGDPAVKVMFHAEPVTKFALTHY